MSDDWRIYANKWAQMVDEMFAPKLPDCPACEGRGKIRWRTERNAMVGGIAVCPFCRGKRVGLEILESK